MLVSDALEAMVAPLRSSNPTKAAQVLAIVTAANKGQLQLGESRALIAEALELPIDDYVQSIKSAEIKNYALLDVIIGLRQQYKIGLLSNVTNLGLTTRFTSEELSKHFDTVVVSGDIGYAKPEANAYEITAERLGVRTDECIMIDDRTEYCDGARSVGMQAIVYESFPNFQQELAALLSL